MLLVALKLQLRVVKSMDLGSGIMKGIMKYTTVKISEIRKHPTLRLDPKYWIKRKNKKRPAAGKHQASSTKLQAAGEPAGFFKKKKRFDNGSGR